MPCGVERRLIVERDKEIEKFLMCRVELKVLVASSKMSHSIKFLMCRVELKAP